MNLKRLIDKLLPRLAKVVIKNIKSQIRGRRFNAEPFGAPLSQKTIEVRKKKGRHHTTALYDEGKFFAGLTHRKTGYGEEVFSTGRTKKQQRFFIMGTRNIPARDPFVKNLPTARGGTIEERIVYIAGKEIEAYVDKEISKLKGVT